MCAYLCVRVCVYDICVYLRLIHLLRLSHIKLGIISNCTVNFEVGRAIKERGFRETINYWSLVKESPYFKGEKGEITIIQTVSGQWWFFSGMDEVEGGLTLESRRYVGIPQMCFSHIPC